MSRNENIARTYFERGYAHIRKSEYGKALKDFRKAGEHNPDLALADPVCQVASNVQTEAAFRHLTQILAIVQAIKVELIWAPSKHPQPIAHYTGLIAMKKLASGDSFRLYNADYMNDPEEGKIFLTIIDSIIGGDHCKDLYSVDDKNSLSSAYIGSFIREENGSKDGTLFLWRTYGKHEGVEAAGACVHFDISKFSDTPSALFGRMHYSSEMSHAPQMECVYQVKYENEIVRNQNDPLWSMLKALADRLKDGEKQKWTSEAESNNASRVTRELLDEIRFLFKANHYREERELRIVQSHYVHADAQLGDDDNVKIDIDRLPPRFYLETKNLGLKEVILGPMTQGVTEWKRWHKEQSPTLNVHKSNIRYGKKNP